jgi:fermentation-respiration switch protein FrsA (DUF1100 family)
MNKLYLIIAITIIFSGCDLDSNLFNTESISEYKLPGNTIAKEFIDTVKFPSDGKMLYGFWIKSEGKHPRLTILYCHGNKHSLDEYWDRVMLFHRLDYNVLIFDYRGFGKSEGTSSEESLYTDAKAALNYVYSKGVRQDSIIVYGYSLGNVPAIYLAANTLKPLGLISEAPFASANSLTQGSTVLDIPAGWLTSDLYDNASQIKNIKAPYLLFHGQDDDFVRYRDNGRVVFENAPEPKILLLIEGAKHTDIPSIMGYDAYLKAISSWVEEVK